MSIIGLSSESASFLYLACSLHLSHLGQMLVGIAYANASSLGPYNIIGLYAIDLGLCYVPMFAEVDYLKCSSSFSK